MPQLKAGTTQVVLDLDQELKVNGPETKDADVIWAPDSKHRANASSAFFYAYSARDENEAAALLTLKFDAEGKWKLVNIHRMSKKELEEEQ